MPSENSTALPSGVPPLTSLYLYIAGSCNLACSHCWISPEFQKKPDQGPFLQYEYIESAIRQARPLGLQSVKLTGGEPLLHPDFRRIFSQIRDQKIFCPIETNGILIDEKMAEFIAGDKIKPFVSISIDGATAETHEKLRGIAGCFEKSVQAVKHLVKRGLRPQIICTLHRGNAGEMEEVVKMAEGLGAESVKFNQVQEVGRGKTYRIEHGLTVSESISLYHRVEEKIAPQSTLNRVLFDIPFAFYPINRFLKGRLGKCNIQNILGILATGDISLCGIGTAVPELVYGKIGKDSIKEIWFHHPELIKLRKKIPQKLEGICYNCIHRDLCLGNCVANNYFQTGRLTAAYSFCVEADRLGIFPGTRKKNMEETDASKEKV